MKTAREVAKEILFGTTKTILSVNASMVVDEAESALRSYALEVKEECARVAEGVYVVNPYSPEEVKARVLERREHAKDIASAIRSIEIK